jgi:TRAP-type C4-dicarboxylate transport system permease small subunit
MRIDSGRLFFQPPNAQEGCLKMDTETVLKKLGWLSSKLSYLGAGALFIMMLLTAADVAGRYLFNKPILGAFELTEFLVLILIFSFLAHAQAEKTHVSVDLLVGRLPEKWRMTLSVINHAVCLALVGLIAWMSAIRAMELKEYAEASSNLGIPKYPFAYFVVIGCAVLALEYMRDLIRMAKPKKKGVQR